MAASLKIRRDDEVVVISGKDRGKTGKVLKVDPKKERVTVEGINIVKRHTRPNSFFVRTTTALTTSPFLTVPCGVACLTVAVMMSPTPA